jgi:hypothetical protein
MIVDKQRRVRQQSREGVGVYRNEGPPEARDGYCKSRKMNFSALNYQCNDKA